MMKSAIFIFFFILATQPAFAWIELGNGGDAVKCKKKTLFSQKTTYQMLDEYEAGLRSVKLDMGPADLSVDKKVEKAIERLKKVDPPRAARYAEWFKSFYAEANFSPDERLPNILDSGIVLIPVGCQLRQVAGQQEPTLPGDKRYVVNGTIWDLMSNDSKALMITHELVLRDIGTTLKGKPFINTKLARYFNMMINSANIDGMNAASYKELLEKSMSVTK